MAKKYVSRWSSAERKRDVRKRKNRGLFLESLEQRSLMAVFTWDGGGSDNNWLTADNWTANLAPAAGDDLVFPAGASQLSNTNNFAAGTRFNTIQLSGAGYTLNGNALELMGGLTANNVTAVSQRKSNS